MLLHGWINSWGVWQDSMIDLAENGQYKVYALDFWGFGDSGDQYAAVQSESYAQWSINSWRFWALSARRFSGIPWVELALSFALAYPQRVTKVGAVGSPIEGKSLNFFLRLAGRDCAALAQSFAAATHMIVNALVRINTARDTHGAPDVVARRRQDQHGVVFSQHRRFAPE
jgi:pimeloyl-ACP methyl ester carboxylesterase